MVSDVSKIAIAIFVTVVAMVTNATIITLDTPVTTFLS
jgi:hypothetical protein